MPNENEEQFIVHGPKLEVPHPNQPLGNILMHTMRMHGEKIAHINATDGSSETFNAFLAKSICVATNLRLQGIGKGDNISICSKNQSNAFATAVGAVLVGAPVNGLDVGLATGDLKHLLNLLRPKAVFTEVEALPVIERAVTELQLKTKIVVYDDVNTSYIPFSVFLERTGTEQSFVPAQFDNLKEATAIIVCSSGTSGFPKGVMLSHHTLVGQIVEAATTKSFKDMPDFSLVMMMFATLYWVSGITTVFSTLAGGVTRIYASEGFSEKLALEIIEKYKPSVALVAPTICNRLVKYPGIEKHDLSPIRAFVIIGGKCSPEQASKLKQLLPKGFVSMGFGMTEFGGPMTTNSSRPSDLRTTGKLLNGIQGKVVDPDTGKILGANKIGELCFKSEYIMQGYYNNPEETKSTLRKDGWLHTGDLGYFDEEGFLYVTDRIKEVLKFQGYQVVPAEIESELMNHPEVVECSVVGIPHDLYGDLLLAFVLSAKGSKVTEDDLKAHIAGQMADTKRLRGGVIFLDSIPMLPSGKVNRKLLKAKALAMREEIIAKAD